MFGCVLLSNRLFVHCYAHSLNLVVQDTRKKFTLYITNEIPKVVKGNPKREAWLLLKKYKDFSTLGDYIDTLITRNIMF